MQNNNVKNQNNQLPAQVAAVISETSSLKKVAVKATLFHLDGHTSEILMTLPNYTSWGEYLETGKNAIRDYVFCLTRHWIKISHFEIVMGNLKPDGSICSLTEPVKHEIPLGLYYQAAKAGQWVNAEQHTHHPRFNERGSSLNLTDLMKIINERGEAIYHQLDDHTMLCGIPSESRALYFQDGDIPSGEFCHEGKQHFVVYSLVKASNHI